MAKLNIFITGATGYVGGTVLSRLLEHVNVDEFTITALVRSEDKAKVLENLTKVKAVVGSHKDVELVENLASQADIILSLASAGDLELAKAQLRGAQTKHKVSEIQPSYIHISGSVFLADDSFGMHAPKDIISDLDTDKINSFPATPMPPRNVDVELIKADNEGFVKTYIVVPGLIYGAPHGKIADSGTQNTTPHGFGFLFSSSVARGEAGMVGQGKNEWAHVEVGEVADLVVLLFDSATSKPTSHGREGFYFAENGGNSMFDMGKAVAQILVEAGRTTKSEPTTFTQAELDKYLPSVLPRLVGGNTRCSSERSRSLGWRPVKGENDFYASLRVEVKKLL
ncbi:hypothetical protein C8J56DRAFT_251361 [Mycena floridula]|nr:hypothetical protein C8J56DRAFT_251361 [Mycena floridula]